MSEVIALPMPAVRREVPPVPKGPLRRPRIPLSVVTKPNGAACNLDCKYCFFLSKELLYDAKRQQMDSDTLARYIAEFLAASPDGPVTLLWQGGEPTMRGLPFFRQAVQFAQKYRRSAQTVTHAIQTNGTLINPEWAEFLAENNFLVGVSIDGPADLHDAYRVNKAERGTHAQVIRGWNYLQAAGVECNILCTVHRANQGHPSRVYRYFRDELGAKYLQFIPIVERVEGERLALAEAGWRAEDGTRLLYTQSGQAVTSRSVDPVRYGKFLSRIFDLWIRRDVGTVFVQDFDSALSGLFGQPSVCVHAPSCGFNLAMEFNGDVYACDHWVEPDWLLGNVHHDSFSQLARSSRMQQFGQKKAAQLTEECKQCPFLRVCWGGCPKDRFVSDQHGHPGHNYLCPGYKAFYGHIMPDLIRMGQLLQSGRPASDIMYVH